MVPVLVSATFIEDGEARPVVGETVTFRARFVEVSEAEDPDPELHRWWDASATPVGEPYRSHPLGGEPRGPWWWSTVLRGPGWDATWSAPRQVQGAGRLRGVLSADYDFSTLNTTITGEIVRVRVITEAQTPFAGAALGRLVAGSRAYHDVEASPLAFQRGRGIPAWAPEQPVATEPAHGAELPPDAQVQQIGVLADLQLL